jgi:hypothetical protein
MKLNTTGYETVSRSRLVAPTLGAARVKSAFFRVLDHAQATSPINGAAGMVTGHRSWSPPIT